MGSAMEQTRYWMWTRRKFSDKSLLFNPAISTSDASSSYHESWEEQAFAEDSARLMGGCIWPPRSYTCSFCRREFRSAQALGGHMNVHRRDRARLRQSSSPADEQYSDQVNTLEYYSPSPNPNPNPNSGDVIGSSLPSPSEHNLVSPSHSSLIAREPRNESIVLAGRSFINPIPVRVPSSLELKLEFGNWKRDWKEDDEKMINSKRRRTDMVLSSIIKPPSGDVQFIGPSEVLKLSSNPIEELDLELRLGDPPKIK